MGQGPSALPDDEIEALVELFDESQGVQWLRRDGWRQQDVDPQHWFGVQVENGHVVALCLANNGLKGTLCESLGHLRHLRVLDLSNNHIHGEIPSSIGQLTQLIEVNLSMNEFRGAIPKSICQCHELQKLHLFQNSLSGILPAQLGQLTQLESLQLQFNCLTGTLPTSIGQLKQLTQLSVRGNCMSGPIPSEIGALSSLTMLSLRNNEFSGRIPSSLSDCTCLEYLDLSSNRFSGRIPESLCELTGLRVLYLFDNMLEGTVPLSVANLPNLKECDFTENQFKSDLPDFLDGHSDFQGFLANITCISSSRDESQASSTSRFDFGLDVIAALEEADGTDFLVCGNLLPKDATVCDPPPALDGAAAAGSRPSSLLQSLEARGAPGASQMFPFPFALGRPSSSLRIMPPATSTLAGPTSTTLFRVMRGSPSNNQQRAQETRPMTNSPAA